MRILLLLLISCLSVNYTYSQLETYDVYIPNSFTSDGDGLNDAWRTYSDIEWDVFTIEVYNPWGALIWYSNDQNEWWMGESNMDYPVYYSPNGIYHYVLSLRKDEKSFTKKGTIYKLR